MTCMEFKLKNQKKLLWETNKIAEKKLKIGKNAVA